MGACVHGIEPMHAPKPDGEEMLDFLENLEGDWGYGRPRSRQESASEELLERYCRRDVHK